MELANEFTVDAPVERAWQVLTEVERVATCIPGATLESVEGEEFTGTVRVKVGPITAQYKGKARFAERDDAAHRVVIKAEGRETRGQGNASATITATLSDVGGSTHAEIVTDLNITGKVAQFGRGVLADVSTKLMGQFADSLQEELRQDASATVGGEAVGNGSGTASENGATRPARPAEAVNLLTVAGGSMVKRLAAPILSLGAAILAFVFFRRRRRKNK